MKILLSKAYHGLAAGQTLEMDDADATALIADGTATKAVAAATPPAEPDDAVKFRAEARATLDSLTKEVRKVVPFIESVKTSLAERPAAAYAKGAAGLGQFMLDVGQMGAEHRSAESLLQSKAAPERLRKYVGAMLESVEKKTLADAQVVAVDAAGGVTVPVEQMTEMLTQMSNADQYILKNVRGVPMSSQYAKLPMAPIFTRATAAGRHGGIQSYTIDESQAKTPSRFINFREAELKLNEDAIFVKCSDSLITFSAISIGSFIGGIAAQEITFKQQLKMFSGTGVGEPLGFTNAANPSRIAVTRDTAAQVRFADVLEMWNRRYAPNSRNYIWLVEQTVEPWMRKFAWMPVEGGTAAVAAKPEFTYDQNGQPRLFGAPVYTTEFCATAGTSTDICLVDLTQYLHGYRASNPVEFAESIHLYFDTNERAFRWTWYQDGLPWWPQAITPLSGGASRSPFIVLTT